MAEIKSTSELNFKDIPDTEAYQPYKKEFLDILKMFDEKNNEVSCDYKMVMIMKRIHETVQKMKNNESEEFKKIREIAMKNKNDKFGEIYAVGLEYAKHPESYSEEFC